eukprot:3332740-Amphidinium_carterae.1
MPRFPTDSYCQSAANPRPRHALRASLPSSASSSLDNASDKRVQLAPSRSFVVNAQRLTTHGNN